jgi:inner membrane protease subunit 1
MLPTVFEGDYLLLKKLQSKNTISRGNIVVCKSPHDPRVSVCKRVIGLEGDIINTRTEHGTISNQLRIPKGHVWVEGDNTGESIDSRTYGPMPKGMVDGKVVLRVFPSIGRLP